MADGDIRLGQESSSVYLEKIIKAMIVDNYLCRYIPMTLSADHTAVGDVIPSGTAAENLSMGQVCYLNSNGKWALADADAYSTAGTKLAVCIEGSGISTDATGKFLLWGVFRDDSITVTKGAANYLSTTAGAFNETALS